MTTSFELRINEIKTRLDNEFHIGSSLATNLYNGLDYIRQMTEKINRIAEEKKNLDTLGSDESLKGEIEAAKQKIEEDWQELDINLGRTKENTKEKEAKLKSLQGALTTIELETNTLAVTENQEFTKVAKEFKLPARVPTLETDLEKLLIIMTNSGLLNYFELSSDKSAFTLKHPVESNGLIDFDLSIPYGCMVPVPLGFKTIPEDARKNPKEWIKNLLISLDK